MFLKLKKGMQPFLLIVFITDYRQAACTQQAQNSLRPTGVNHQSACLFYLFLNICFSGMDTVIRHVSCHICKDTHNFPNQDNITIKTVSIILYFTYNQAQYTRFKQAFITINHRFGFKPATCRLRIKSEPLPIRRRHISKSKAIEKKH